MASVVWQLISLASVNWEDPAHSLAGLPDKPTWWVMYKYSGFEENLPKVRRALIKIADIYIKAQIKYATHPSTPSAGKSQVRRLRGRVVEGLVELARIEFEQPFCTKCHGTGWKFDREVEIRVALKVATENDYCPSCKGGCKNLLSERQRTNIVGIDHKGMSKRHESVITYLMHTIASWEKAAFDNVHRLTDCRHDWQYSMDTKTCRECGIEEDMNQDDINDENQAVYEMEKQERFG